MKLLENRFAEKLPLIRRLRIRRYNPSGVAQEQKTIGTVQGRIENAEKTFNVVATETWDTVLLIDDLVGSTATLNTVAKKIKEKGIAKRVCAITIVGVNAKKFPIVKRA